MCSIGLSNPKELKVKKNKRQHPTDGYECAKGNDEYHGKDGHIPPQQKQPRKGANKNGGKLHKDGEVKAAK